jgi:thiamine-monophosphate kinase
LKLDPLALAASGGEDYELLLTCPPEAVEGLSKAVGAGSAASLTVIGEVIAGADVLMLDREGRERPLGSGFDHFAAPG